MTPTTTTENLKRAIGVKALTLAILNMTVGSGIFVIPALVAESLGTAAIFAYLICGVLIFLIALCFAEVGSKTTVSGGVYTYIENAFGPYAGFIANNVYWFGGSVISDAAVANALADTLKHFIPAFGETTYRALFFFVAFGGLALLNIRSVKNGVRIVELAAFGKLIPLVAVVVAGLFFIKADNLTLNTLPPAASYGTASLLLFFAFVGLETPLSNGGEIKDPRRTVPLGIFFGILCVLILYIAIQIVSQGVLGPAIIAHKNAPLGAVAGVIFGKAGFTIVIIVMAISMSGYLSGAILSVPRMLFAGARDGLMPKVLAKVHPRFFTPHIAIGFYAFLGFVFAVSGGFKQLAVMASASSLLVYLGIVLATIKLRKNETITSGKTFKVRGGVLVPVLAACVVVWLLSNLTKAEFTAIGIFIAAASLLYLFIRFRKKGNNSRGINEQHA